MTKNGCIYTCLIGDYDSLIIPSVFDDDCDYVCYTDQKQLLCKGFIGPWKILPLLYTEQDTTRNQRWHKILGYECLGDYKYSIYIDSNVDIKSPYIYNICKDTKKPVLIPIHNVRSCIYDEIDVCEKIGKDTPETLQRVRDFLTSEKMPHDYGLTENNLIFRKHDSEDVKQIMYKWWEIVMSYSKRDQLSLAYVLWKYGVNISDIVIPNIRVDYKNFEVYPHISSYTVHGYLFKLLCGYEPYRPLRTFNIICKYRLKNIVFFPLSAIRWLFLKMAQY